MEAQKKTMFLSIVVLLLTLLLAFLIEIRIINNFFNIGFLSGHRSFVVSWLNGISASAFVAFSIAYGLYFFEKRKIVEESHMLMLEFLTSMHFVGSILREFEDKNNFVLTEDNVDFFCGELKNFRDTLQKIMLLYSRFSPIFHFRSKYNFLARRQMLKTDFNFALEVYCTRCKHLYGDIILLYEYIRTRYFEYSDENGKIECQIKIEELRKTITPTLSADSDFEALRKTLELSICNYLKYNIKVDTNKKQNEDAKKSV